MGDSVIDSLEGFEDINEILACTAFFCFYDDHRYN